MNKCIRKYKDQNKINESKEKLKLINSELRKLSQIINVIGNEVRFKILFLLLQNEKLCVCDLSDILEMNQSAVSQHLRKLKDRNIVQTDREGQTIYYYLTQENKNILQDIFKYLELKPIKL